MLENYNSELTYVSQGYDEKQLKKYQIQTLLNISAKLVDKENEDIESMMISLKNMLKNISDDAPLDFKIYKRLFAKLKDEIKNIYNYYEKGDIQSNYMGLGIAFGSGLSIIFQAFLGVGMSLGLVIGAGIGKQKESVALKDGRIY